MYLKSLQLIGFKSFAERTNLEFLPGVTAIVGPNGCGKSNVSDAIRWVLGEQSAKALRGKEMADVIFSGTDGRKPIGMCEVSMTFADVDPSQLTMPGVNLEYAEITITRRVYRDGTGEYLINKTPCRLRDIQGLFMDTGIGRSSYSMMAQGQIDQILSARPDDRRNIFEEAAGINKYKHQKKEALRKLEYTEANLVRLTDIIKEVKRQIISLQRQAGKARRYKELFDKLKQLDTQLSRHRYDEILAETRRIETQLAEIAAQSEQFAAQIGEQESQIADLRRSLGEIESAINRTVEEDHFLQNDFDRHQHRIQSNHERIAELQALVENNNREIAASEEKIRVQEQDLNRLNAAFDQIDAELAAEQATLASHQQQLQAVEDRLATEQSRFDNSKSALFELETEITRHRNELADLDKRKQEDVLRAERLSNERAQLEEQRTGLGTRLEQFHVQLDALRQEAGQLRTAAEDAATRRREAADQLATASTAQQNAVDRLAKKRARLEVLGQLFAAPDGRNTLGQVLDVAPEDAPAIEAALSHNLRIILADDLDNARALLDSGVNNPAVASADLATPAGAVPAMADLNAGGLRPAVDRVRAADSRFEPLLRALLADVFIADDLEQALAAHRRHPGRAIATRAGELVSPQGVLSKVSQSHMAEITELTAEVNQLQREADDCHQQKTGLDEQDRALGQELDQLRDTLHQKEIDLAGRDSELNLVTAEQRETENRLHTVMFELNSLEEQESQQAEQRQALTAALDQSSSRETALRTEVAAARQAVADLAIERKQAADTATEQRIRVGGFEHRRESIQNQRDPISGRVHDLRERIESCTAEIVTHEQRTVALGQEIGESEQQKQVIDEKRAALEQKLNGLRHQRSEVATGIDQAETELRALRTQAANSQEQKSGFDVQLAQKSMERQALKERVWQKYQVNIDDVAPDAINITVADQGPAVTEQVPLDTDWEAVEQEVTELQTKLDSMGPVNVEAIQEFDELEERYQFLSQQHDDLVKAKAQLLQVISKINATTRQLFTETFEKVRTNFQQMFTELFGGGKANLLLLDENDPLESGIEIVAKPPGKQLQSITLLSGGERTLTATALLFAIYMVKPSPFCVLDELDAPLDDSNINRFIRILQRFIKLSQFVVITHNKRTIGMADALYGITMEEHGVSKVVSVKFSPREEEKRKQTEQSREEQEDRIDGAAVLATPVSPADQRPHEENLGNDLLDRKQDLVEEIRDDVEVTPEQNTRLGERAPMITADDDSPAADDDSPAADD